MAGLTPRQQKLFLPDAERGIPQSNRQSFQNNFPLGGLPGSTKYLRLANAQCHRRGTPLLTPGKPHTSFSSWASNFCPKSRGSKRSCQVLTYRWVPSWNGIEATPLCRPVGEQMPNLTSPGCPSGRGEVGELIRWRKRCIGPGSQQRRGPEL